MNPLQKGPIANILDAQVVVTNPEGREFQGAVVAATAAHFDVRYATGHRGQFTATKRFRRKTLRGYDEGWTVKPAEAGPAMSKLYPGFTEAYVSKVYEDAACRSAL